MTDLKIVPLRDGKPSLNDVPARLRLLADQIEAGNHGEVETVFVVIPRLYDYPTTLAYGPIDGPNDPLIQFELAKMFHYQMFMGRT